MAYTEHIVRAKQLQKLSSTEYRTFHPETDPSAVIVDANRTLADILTECILGNKTITLTGDVSGTVTVAKGAGTITISTEVGDDTHGHSGAYIKLTTGGRVVVSNPTTKAITESNVTTTELGYVSGVTSAIQTQIDSKVNVVFGGTTAPSSQATGDFWFQDVT